MNVRERGRGGRDYATITVTATCPPPPRTLAPTGRITAHGQHYSIRSPPLSATWPCATALGLPLRRGRRFCPPPAPTGGGVVGRLSPPGPPRWGGAVATATAFLVVVAAAVVVAVAVLSAAGLFGWIFFGVAAAGGLAVWRGGCFFDSASQFEEVRPAPITQPPPPSY